MMVNCRPSNQLSNKMSMTVTPSALVDGFNVPEIRFKWWRDRLDSKTPSVRQTVPTVCIIINVMSSG